MSDRPVAVVGMSGGVDSCVTAHLAKAAGYRVVGVMLQIKDPGASRDADEAAFLAAAKKLAVETEILPVPEFREKVILPAATQYADGRTPNPCCMCNAAVKFAKLFEVADALGNAKVWTGHYAIAGNGRIFCGADRVKEQSYFLYRLDEKMRRRVAFPLGTMTKEDVRALAEKLELPVAKRPDSQDVCFKIPGECCGETLRRLAGLPEKRGYFLYRGKIVGSHKGIHRYTIGQRTGLGVALGTPAYIQKIDARSGDITLDTDPGETGTNRFFLTDLVLHGDLPEKAEIRIRYRSRSVPCTLTWEKERIQVTTQENLFAVTPGQSGVFYTGNLVAGGGIIALE